MVAMLLGGTAGFRYLPVASLPQADYPTIEIRTFYPGASPDVVASGVTAPLEKQLGEMPGLDQMNSTSSAGASIITLQFSLDLALDVAEQEVQAAINASTSFLPSDLPAPPIYAKINPADAPALTLAVTSSTWPLAEVEAIAESRLVRKISQMPGVGLVNVSGGQKKAIRIRVNLRVLYAYGLNLDDLRTTIGSASANGPKGRFESPGRSYSISANDQLKSIADYKKIIIAYRNAAPVYLSDVADVSEGVENNVVAAWSGQTPAVVLNIHRQPGANVIAVIDHIKAMLPQLRETLPVGIDLAVSTDRTTTIRASVNDVGLELSFAIGLVVLVIYLFLRNLRATLIPCISVPFSILGTFALMYFLGFSLNNLTLMGLTVATGFVVDDAIVMIENISRYMEAGDMPRDAALRGSKQIVFTIISLTVSLIAVLIPLLFMNEVIGRLFREFAITLAITILISAIVSLVFVPMLCSKLLKVDGAREAASTFKSRGYGFVRIRSFYERLLDCILRHEILTIISLLLTVGLTVYLCIIIPKGFFPTQDTGVVLGVSVAPASVSFPTMAERQQNLAAVILHDPDVESLTSFVGIDGINKTLNSGRLLINLKQQRNASAVVIARRLAVETSRVAGIALYLQPAQDLTVDTSSGRTQYQLVLEDTEQSDFDLIIPRLLDRLRQDPHLLDVSSSSNAVGLGAYLEIDRDTAARFGITLATVDNALYDAFGQRIVSTIFSQSDQFRVILEADPSSHAFSGVADAVLSPFIHL